MMIAPQWAGMGTDTAEPAVPLDLTVAVAEEGTAVDGQRPLRYEISLGNEWLRIWS